MFYVSSIGRVSPSGSSSGVRHQERTEFVFLAFCGRLSEETLHSVLFLHLDQLLTSNHNLAALFGGRAVNIDLQ